MSTTMTVYAYVSDLDRMRRFYEGALGVKPATRHGNWLPFDLGGATFALHGIERDRVEDVRRFKLSFTVDDIEAAERAMKAQGLETTPISTRNDGQRAFNINDPDGNRIEICTKSGFPAVV